MSYNISVDMQSPDASMTAMSPADVSMTSLTDLEDLKNDSSPGIFEITRRLEDLTSRPILQSTLPRSRTDEIILGEIERRLGRLRAITSIIANDQAELHMLQRKLTDIYALAINSHTSADFLMHATNPSGLADNDMSWLLTEWGCENILAICVRDWAILALDWVNGVMHNLDAFDDKVIESMDVLRGRRGSIKNSENIFLRSANNGGHELDSTILAMQSCQLDEEINLVLPMRPVFPRLDTDFPRGFLPYEQDEFNERAKHIYALGLTLAGSD